MSDLSTVTAQCVHCSEMFELVPTYTLCQVSDKQTDNEERKGQQLDDLVRNCRTTGQAGSTDIWS